MATNNIEQNRRKLYDALAPRIGDIGTWDEFNNKLNDESNRRKLYDALSPRIGDIGTWNEFNARIYQAPEPQQIAQPVQPVQQPAQPQVAATLTPTPTHPTSGIVVQPETPAATAEQPEASAVPKFNVGDTFKWKGKAYRLNGFKDDGTARVQMDGDLTPRVMTSEQLNEAEPFTAWTPTAQQRAAMQGRIDHSMRQFNEDAESGQQRMENLMEYNKSVASLSGEPMKGKMVFNPTTGKLEQSYITPYGDETTDQYAAEMAAREFRAEKFAVSLPGRIMSTQKRVEQIKKAIDKRTDELAKEASRRDSGRGILERIVGGITSAEGGYVDDGGYTESLKTDRELNVLRLSLRQAQESLQQLENARGQQERESDGSRFWGSRVLKAIGAVNPVAGVLLNTGEIAAGNDFMEDFTKGTMQAIGDIRAWDFGYGNLRDAMTLQGLVSKLESGKELTETERDAMMDLVYNRGVMAQFGDLGRGFRWGNITGTSLSFMKDFMLTGAFGGWSGITARGTSAIASRVAPKLATKAATRLAEREVLSRVAQRGFLQFVKNEGMAGVGALLKEQSLPWAVKALGTTADDLLVRAPMMVNTVQGMSTMANIINNKAGNATYNPETNQFTFEDGTTWSNAVWQSEADQVIENFSEMWGAHLPGLTNMTKAFGARNLTAAILRSTREGAGTVISTASKFLKRAGVNGYFGEVGEEYYGQAWRTMLGLDSAYDENGQNLFKSGQFHGDIWGGMALSVGLTGGGAMAVNSGFKYGGKAVDYYMIRNAVNRSDRRASTTLTAEVWDPMRTIIDATDNANIGALAEQVWNDQSMTDAQKSSVLDYMEAAMVMRGHNLRDFVTQQSEEEHEGRSAMADAYTEGINIESAEDRNRARMSLNYEAEQLRNALNVAENTDIPRMLSAMYGTDDINAIVTALYNDEAVSDRERTAIVDYLKASNRYNGMMQAVNDKIEADIAAQEEFVDSNSDHTEAENPVMRPATLRLDDERVFIIGGNVQMLPDGTMVDLANSDSAIFIRRKNGSLDTIDAADILNISQPESATAAKQRMAEETRNRLTAEFMSQINGTIAANPGDIVPVQVGEDIVEAQVVQNDGSNVAVAMPGGSQAVVPLTQIQDIATQQAESAYRAEIEASKTTEQLSEEFEPIIESEDEAAGGENAPDENGLTLPRDKGLFPDEYEAPYSGQRLTASRYIENGDFNGMEYVNPTTGTPDVIIAAVDDNSYVGYFREYDNDGNPTNEWSAKFENHSGDRSVHAGLMQTAAKMLPPDHELTEHTSVSTDGLRNLANQLRHGYTMQTNPDGTIKGRWVTINAASRNNDLGIDYTEREFENVHVTDEQFDTAKRNLAPLMLELGIDPDAAIRMVSQPDGKKTIQVYHPTLLNTRNAEESTATTEATATDDVPTFTPSTEFALNDNLVFGEGTDSRLVGAHARIVSIDNSDITEPQYVVEYTTPNGDPRVMYKTAADLTALQASVVPPGVEDSTVPNPAENAAPVVENQPETVSNEENVQPPAPTALSQIPIVTNAKGKVQHQWTAVEPRLAWDGLVERTADEELAQTFANNKVDLAQKTLDKAQKVKPKAIDDLEEFMESERQRKQAIVDAQTQLDAWKRIAAVAENRRREIQMQQEAEARRFAAERAEKEKAEHEAREEQARIEREALNGIPEWHMDTPENARARGTRRFSGQLFTRQEPVQGVAGKEVEVKFSQKDLPKGRVAVIEAGQLQPSHLQGQRNPMFFIDEAQPKNRSEAVSAYSAQQIAEVIRPEEITGNATAYTGAPTVNARGEVIQGNNRSDALRYLWGNNLPQQQAAYKQYLLDNAEQLGIDPEAVNAMQQPVLVNMLDVDDAEAIRLGQMTAQDTESGGIERIKPKNVAQLLGEGMRTFANMLLRSGDEEATFGQLVDSNGTEVLGWMNKVGAITNTQYQSAFDSKGNLTAEAKNDLQKVLYQAIFKGASQQLEEMFDKLPAKAQRALLATAFRDMDSPFAGKMLPEIQSSIVAFSLLMSDPTFAEAKKMEEVVRAIDSFKATVALDDRFEQHMPADNFSNFALHLAGMYKANDMSQTTIALYFNQMYDLAQGKKAATLFEEADTTEYPLADVIKKVLNIDYQPAKNGNNNVANGGADVALRNQVGQGGELRSTEPPASGEQTPAGTEPSDRGAGVADDSGRGGTPQQDRADKEKEVRSLTTDEAIECVADMENNAPVAQQMPLTVENWDNQFPNGKVVTPIGEVKMGEHQFLKLMREGRNSKLGMIRPTLEHPHIIVEVDSEAKEGDTAERPTSYIFIKSFKKADGSRYYYFTSISVSKDGMEVVVSNQEKSRNKILRLLTDGSVIWRAPKDAATASVEQQGLEYVQPTETETAANGSGITPQSTSISSTKPVSVPAVGEGTNTDTSEVNSGQTEGATAPAGNSSQTSDRKDTKSLTDEQMSGEESSLQPSDDKGAGLEQTSIQAASAEVNTEPKQEVQITDEMEDMNSFQKGQGERGVAAKLSVGESIAGNREAYEAAKGLLETAGVPVYEVSAAEAQAMLGRSVQLSAAKRRALDTFAGASAKTSSKTGSGSTNHQGSVVKFEDSAKVLNNLDNLANKYDEIANASPKSFIGELSKALELHNNGNHSNYGSFETKNDLSLRIRVSDHNAEVKNFDDAGYDNGISIVISRKGNGGLMNNGDAHIVEYYYNGYKLAKADGHPLAEVARSLRHALYSGEYRDTTGLAERQEVNGEDVVRFSIETYHGTGADFENFDFSHMGEGEGAQAFGWGGYVSEVKGIGLSYAQVLRDKIFHNDVIKRIIINRIDKALENGSPFEQAKESLLSQLQPQYQKAKKSPELYQSFIDDYDLLAGLTEAEYQNRHLYTVKIPDDNGNNYLDWDGRYDIDELERIASKCGEIGAGDLISGEMVEDEEGDVTGYTTGKDIYQSLAEINSFESETRGYKEASEILSNVFVGIKYPADYHKGGRSDGAKNYVIFKESDMLITDHIRFLKDGKGQVYGWTVGGKVYLNRDAINPETPLHEYTHLWDKMVQRENPELWERGKKLMKESLLWDEIICNPNYADIRYDEDAVASEVHSRLVGERGAQLLDEMINAARKEGPLAEAEAITFVSRLRKWLREMFVGLKKTLGKWSKRNLGNLTVEDFSNMTLRDLALGVNPNHGDRELVTLHNISEKKLRKAIKAGGLANPSMAVVKAGLNSHNGYGSITLVARDLMADKRSGRNAGTWAGDAWTPMYPPIEREQSIVDKAAVISEIAARVPSEMRDLVKKGWESHMSGGNEASLAYWFLSERGEAPELSRRERKFDAAVADKVLSLVGDRVIKLLSPDEANTLKNLYIKYEMDGDRGKYEQFMALSEKSAKERLGKPAGLFKKKAEVSLDMIERLGLLPSIMTWVNDIRSDARLGNRIDGHKTSSDANKIIGDKGLNGEFERWIEGLDERFGVEEKLFAGYTASGYRRLLPNTAENASNIMRAQGRNGSTGMSTGFSSFVASVLEPMKSIKDMHNQTDRLRDSHDDTEAFDNKWSKVYFDLAIKCQPDAERISDDYGFYRLNEAAVKKNPVEYLKSEYGIELSAKDATLLAEMVDAIRRERPIQYFETKFERPVMLNEFAAAVVPENIDSELEQALKSAGLLIEKYSPDKSGDRQRAVAMASNEDNIRFHAAKSNDMEEFEPKMQHETDNGTVISGRNERKKENRSGFYSLRPKKSETSTDRDGDKTKFRLLDENRAGEEYNDTLERLVEEDSGYCENPAERVVIRDEESLASFLRGIGLSENEVSESLREYRELAEAGKTLTGGYDPGTKKILIFAGNLQNRASVSRTLQHEELHHQLDVATNLGNVVDVLSGTLEREFPKLWKNIRRYYADRSEQDRREELVVYSIEKAIGDNELNALYNVFSDAEKIEFTKLIKTIGYEIEHLSTNEIDIRRRTRRVDEGSPGRLATAEGGSADTENSYRNFSPSGRHGNQQKFRVGGRYDGFGTGRQVTDGQPNQDGDSIYGMSSYDTDVDAMRGHGAELAARLHTPVRFIDNVEEITDSDMAVQRKKRTANGWYDTTTGEVVIVLPNNVNVADVEATIFHEVVGHKGMREIVGEKYFGQFLREVYDHASKATRANINALIAKNGWDVELATEEYIAQLAEKGFEDMEAQEQSFWAKVKSKVLDFLKRLFEGRKLPKSISIGDNEIRYMLWRTYQQQTDGSLVGEAENVLMQQRLGVGEMRYSDKIGVLNHMFNEQLGRWTNGEMRASEYIELGRPQGVLKLFAPEVPVILRQKVLTKSQKKHALTAGEMRNLPGALSHPIFVFKSSEHTISMLTSLKTADGKNMFTAIELGVDKQLGHEVMEVNDILTIHGRDIENVVLPIIENDTLVWADKEEGLQWLSSAKSNSQAIATETLDTAAKVIETFENPSVEDVKSSGGLRFRSGKYINAREEYEAKVRTVDERDKRSGEYLRDSQGNKKKANRAAMWREAYLDSMASLKALQDAVANESGEPVEHFENAYWVENRMSSSCRTQTDAWKVRYFEPLMEEVAKLSGKGEDGYANLIDYMMAKHGLERNLYMAQREYDAYMKEHPKAKGKTIDNFRHDYAGLTALFDLTPQEWSDAERLAQDLVNSYEAAHDTSNLWQKVNAASKSTLQTRYEAGLISKDVYDKIRTQYQYYLPLKGWADTVAGDVYEYAAGTYHLGSALHKAFGRNSMADDPIATLSVDAERTIMEANRNNMKMAFLNLAINHPTSLLTVSRQWYVKQADGSWLEANPQIPENATADQVDAIVKQFKAQMEALAKNGDAFNGNPKMRLGLRTNKYEQPQHIVTVKRAGETYNIIINGNPRAALALNGMLNPDAGEPTRLKQWGQNIKDFMSKSFTTWNPAFVVTNLSRDMIFSGVAVGIKENATYAGQYTRNIRNLFFSKGNLFNLLRKYNNGKLDMNDEIERYFYEFLTNGGETGFIQLNSVDKAKKDMERFIKQAQGGASSIPGKAWRGLLNGVEFMNRCAEDTTRFAVYMTSRQVGRSVAESIWNAKEITVNFNKKGSGALGARYFNFLYVFFNATMQAISNTCRLIKNHPVKSTIAMVSFMTSGFVLPLIAQAFCALSGGDPDDYFKLPEWVRRNNLVFYVPFTKKFITIPIPHELCPFYGIGELAYSTLVGEEEAEDALYKAMEGFTGILPVDWTGNGGNVWVSLTPTIAQPLAQVAADVDYFGKPIYKRTPFNADDPEWTKAYRSTHPALVNASKWLYETTATPNEAGRLVGGWDVNPAIAQHLIESYSGGMGKFISQTSRAVSALWDEDARELRNVPIVSKFVQSVDERAVERRNNNAYFDLVDEYDELQRDFRHINEQPIDSITGHAERLTNWLNTPSGRRFLILRDYIKDVDYWRNIGKNAPTEQMKERADSMRNTVQGDMIETMRASEEYPDSIINRKIRELDRERRRQENSVDKQMRRAERRIENNTHR
ncbi:LPD38 domain-containing protein [uncultured Muribaculum sp.]|uniref:LPD38 domain-containing protein n=1 Tax=uncultured Muribaculum sp. TaxID=1918613 RepID=UPI002649D01D|nr:LPD38 domain-containing protein [uncultured Muribaculum sp.]